MGMKEVITVSERWTQRTTWSMVDDTLIIAQSCVDNENRVSETKDVVRLGKNELGHMLSIIMKLLEKKER